MLSENSAVKINFVKDDICVLSCFPVESDSLQRYGSLPSSPLCPWDSPVNMTEWVALPSSGTVWIEPASLCLPHWQADSLTTSAIWEAPVKDDVCCLPRQDAVDPGCQFANGTRKKWVQTSTLQVRKTDRRIAAQSRDKMQQNNVC